MKTLEELTAQNPTAKLATVEVAGSTYVFRRPAPSEWRQYKAAALSAKLTDGQAQVDGTGMIGAFVRLAEACVMSHTPSEMASTEQLYLDLFEELGQAIVGVVEDDMRALGKGRSGGAKLPSSTST